MKNISMSILALILVACVTTPHFEPQRILITGTYTQISTGMSYPESVAGFQRTNVTKFDDKEYDVGVGYNYLSPTEGIAVTIYSYPAPKILSIGSPQSVKNAAKAKLFLDAYRGSKQQILSAHSQGRLIEESSYTLIQTQQTLVGQYAKFEFAQEIAGGNQRVNSLLYLVQSGNTLYKYRITYPASTNPTERIGGFMKKLPLPKST